MENYVDWAEWPEKDRNSEKGRLKINPTVMMDGENKERWKAKNTGICP